MLKKSKHIKSSLKEHIKYTADKMSGIERNAFEKNIQGDPFEEEASEGFSSVSDGEIKKDISSLSSRLNILTGKSNPVIWYRIAASAAILAIVSIVFFTQFRIKPDKDINPIITEFPAPAEEKLISGPQKISPVPEKQGILPETRQKPYEERTDPQSQAGKAESSIKTITSGREILTKEEETTDDELFIADRGMTLTESRKPLPESKIMDSSFHPNVGLLSVKMSEEFPEMKTIRGIIVSTEDTVPLPGVNIVLKGAEMQAVSDIRGEFTIPASGDSLTFLIAQYSGLEDKEIEIKDNSKVRIEMTSFTSEKAKASKIGGETKKKITHPGLDERQDHQLSSSPPVPVNGITGFNSGYLD
jgi:hypothetical protein